MIYYVSNILPPDKNNINTLSFNKYVLNTYPALWSVHFIQARALFTTVALVPLTVLAKYSNDYTKHFTKAGDLSSVEDKQ